MAQKTPPPDVKEHVAETFRKMREQSGFMLVRTEDMLNSVDVNTRIPDELQDTTAAQEFMFELMSGGEWHICFHPLKDEDVTG